MNHREVYGVGSKKLSQVLPCSGEPFGSERRINKKIKLQANSKIRDDHVGISCVCATSKRGKAQEKFPKPVSISWSLLCLFLGCLQFRVQGRISIFRAGFALPRLDAYASMSSRESFASLQSSKWEAEREKSKAPSERLVDLDCHK